MDMALPVISRDRIITIPPGDGALLTFSRHGFSAILLYAARESAELAARASRPVAFQCLDYVVVINPGDDPDQGARAWWLQQYGETPEATWARR
jgi:hypothetical protein